MVVLEIPPRYVVLGNRTPFLQLHWYGIYPAQFISGKCCLLPANSRVIRIANPSCNFIFKMGNEEYSLFIFCFVDIGYDALTS